MTKIRIPVRTTSGKVATRSPDVESTGERAATETAVLPVALGSALAAVGLLAAALTWVPGILIGPPAMQGSARGTAVVVLVAAPLSIAGITLARRGRTFGLMLWLGAVAYLLYNAVLFLFATPYNRLFLLDVVLLALAIFTLIRLVMVAGSQSVSESPRARRWLAGFIWLVVALNSAAWLRAVIPSMWSDRPESVTDGLGVATNPVYVQDLAFWLPTAAIIGWWLWSGRPLGIVLAGGLLGFWLLESVSIAVDQALGTAADPSSSVVSTAVIPGFLVLATAQALALVLHLRAVQSQTPPSGASTHGRARMS
ncbi:MAG TPA: hypothetical protein VLJ88_08805 [Propionibacteriaceae bacterium]|nr:hypothetical protein [Propionibacteriaceae bacterium]